MVNKPELIKIPFAQGGLKNAIPDQSDPKQPGKASLEEGFPAANMLPLDQGGVPPAGRDMNGILNLLSQHIQYINAGGIAEYDADFASQSGGYPLYALLKANQQGFAFWLNSVAGNATDPNGTNATGWVPLVPLSKNGDNILTYQNDGLFVGAPGGDIHNVVQVSPEPNNLLNKNDQNELDVPISQGADNLLNKQKDGAYVGPPSLPWWKKYLPIAKNPGLLRWQDDGLSVLPTPPQTDFYVNIAIGNDANSGFANTQEAAFKTIQGAVDALQARYITPSSVNIHVAPGSYPGFSVNGNSIYYFAILGQENDATAVQIGGTASGDRGCVISYGARVLIRNVYFVTNVENVAATTFSILNLNNCVFSAPTASNPGIAIGSYDYGMVLLGDNCTFKTGTYNCLFSANHGRIILGTHDDDYSAPATVIFEPDITVTSGVVIIDNLGVFSLDPSEVTFQGQITGRRYFISRNSVFAGGTDTTIPATENGVVQSGGISPSAG